MTGMIRLAYADAGWRLWTDGWSYCATREHDTLAAATPVDVLRMVLSHSSMRGYGD